MNKAVVRVAALGVLFISTLRGDVISGVLLGLYTGPSASGTGVAVIQAENEKRAFSFQKPIRYLPSPTDCTLVGAHWTVEYRSSTTLRNGRYPELLSVRCGATYDKKVRAAVSVVIRYYTLISNGDVRKARELWVDNAAFDLANHSTEKRHDVPTVLQHCLTVESFKPPNIAVSDFRCIDKISEDRVTSVNVIVRNWGARISSVATQENSGSDILP